jgi:LPS export ABC transporter protein LptC
MKKWLLGAAAGFLLVACEPAAESDLASLFGQEEDLAEVAENVDIYYSENGMVQLRIQGPKLIRTTHQGQASDVFPQGLHVTFYDDTGAERSWLSAKKGTRFPAEQKILLQDSVVFQNTEDEMLKTSELIWYESNGSMESSKFVEIRRPGERIRGFGFKAEENLTRFEINAVTGRIKAGDLTSDFEQ